MTVADALLDEAHWFARALRGQARGDQEANQIEMHLARYNPQFTVPGRVPQTHYQCPKCWVKDGIRSALRSAPGGDDYDLMRCNEERCGAEFVIPF